MYGEWKFRFLVQAVRSSLRCGTPQPDLRRAARALSKTTLLPDIRQGRAERVPFTLDDTPDKTGLAVVGGDAERRLPPARPPLILTFWQLAARTILRSKV